MAVGLLVELDEWNLFYVYSSTHDYSWCKSFRACQAGKAREGILARVRLLTQSHVRYFGASFEHPSSMPHEICM